MFVAEKYVGDSEGMMVESAIIILPVVDPSKGVLPTRAKSGKVFCKLKLLIEAI